MADYKKMYLTLFQATEDAVNILIAAQRECERLYIDAGEPELTVIQKEKVPAKEEKACSGKA